ncbi:hypothetical protein GE061_018669 [Apolygus lucorum]|uniref:Uncharacterized protein n=1 Tax=Apolygus lucorum TaxID=248454 RepID=A0A8S9XH94_APOLU|nr:hypothetical protein GE061_018669 [Apolygus lucorum]
MRVCFIPSLTSTQSPARGKWDSTGRIDDLLERAEIHQGPSEQPLNGHARTEKDLLEAEVTFVDKGVEVRRGRRHNKAPTRFMNNSAQTDVQRHKYSVFVVMFLLVMALNLWFAYVTFNIHYKVFSPPHIVDKSVRYGNLHFFRSTYIFKKFFAKNIK